ncbi:hypothetical protein [Myxococcus landrumensis]|uniref:Outer membrane protein beta-barrel domain-containing protein n=1 Tax=Myxococcus landrumensis TaxID=2813577 RepID=A0ABX7NEY1_9BACT|nr:hypothetical protein [Myxococcus landrumus]QSQ17016.1 hypothetical protein JY572_13585 [Myxococcus landrumus]
MKALFTGGLLLAGNAVAQEPAPTPESMELGIHLAYARALEDPEGDGYGGPGVRVHLLRNFGEYLAVGGEAAAYSKAGSRTVVTFDGTHHYRTENKPLLQAGAVVRLGVDLGGIRPAFVGGLGWSKGWLETLDVSIGAEIQMTPVEWLPLSVDVRLHESLYSYGTEDDVQAEYVTLGLGWRLRW